jgi:hypothetical protein
MTRFGARTRPGYAVITSAVGSAHHHHHHRRLTWSGPTSYTCLTHDAISHTFAMSLFGNKSRSEVPAVDWSNSLRELSFYKSGHLRSYGTIGEIVCIAVDPVASLIAIGDYLGLRGSGRTLIADICRQFPRHFHRFDSHRRLPSIPMHSPPQRSPLSPSRCQISYLPSWGLSFGLHRCERHSPFLEPRSWGHG